MQLSETIKLYLTKTERFLMTQTMDEYVKTVNGLVAQANDGIDMSRFTSKTIKANLQSSIKNQCIRDAKSIIAKHKKALREFSAINKKLGKLGKPALTKEPKCPILRKPCCYVNNQNFRIEGNHLEFPVMVNGKSKRLSAKTKMTDRQKTLFSNSPKLGTLRIVCKGNKIVAQVVYEASIPSVSAGTNEMGVDLGIKCPAVSYTSDGNIRFYGNGRKNKYMRRYFAKKRKMLQEAKHPDAVKRINNKEQRIMKDIDHKISHDIVKTAVEHNVKVIKLERLSNIRSATSKSRKNNHSLHKWSFYRLAQFIEYKANLAGIAVEYVNPAYTSQTCPVCGCIHHATDRNYVCKCGFKKHRDILGAINICNSTESVGDSDVRRSAQGAICSAL